MKANSGISLGRWLSRTAGCLMLLTPMGAGGLVRGAQGEERGRSMLDLLGLAEAPDPDRETRAVG